MGRILVRRRWSSSTLPSATALPSASTLPLLLIGVRGARGAGGARGARARVGLGPDIASAPADSGRSRRPGTSVVALVFTPDTSGALADPDRGGRDAAPVVVAVVSTRGVPSPHHAIHDASEKAVTVGPSAGERTMSPRGVAGPIRGTVRQILRLASPGGGPLSPSEELAVADRSEILDVQGAELVVAGKLPLVVVQAAVTAAAKATLAAGDSAHGFFSVCWVVSGECPVSQCLGATKVCEVCVSVPRKCFWLRGGERGRLYLLSQVSRCRGR